MSADTISPSELRTMLDEGRPLIVVDIRPTADREWAIPGSIHVDAYDAVSAGSLGALADLVVDRQPLVTVCGVGRIAARATEMLKAQGVLAMTLEGGMRAWSLSWNTAETRVAGCDIVQVRRTGKGCLSYILAAVGDAVVVDASVDLEVYLDLLRTRGWNLVAVVDTHVHADHLSRSRQLAAATGAQLYLPEQTRVRFDFRGLADGDRIPLGTVSLRAWRTPGHTSESTTYVVEDAAAFTGDTLLLSAVGRPDLEGGTAAAATGARLLYQSIQRILELPPQALVLPAHTSQPVPFDRLICAATVSEIRSRVALVGIGSDEFVAAVTDHLPPAPPNHDRIVALNQLGELAEDPIELEAGANRCAVG